MTRKTTPRNNLLGIAITTALGFTAITLPTQVSALHTEVSYSWGGLFTFLDPTGSPIQNTSYPYYGDPTWGYGFRTQISGNLTFDTSTGTGTATMNPFQFGAAIPTLPFTIHDITLNALGDGLGGPGTLIQGDMLYDWNGNNNFALSVIWDASGVFGAAPFTQGQVITGVGAVPASNNITGFGGIPLPIGPAPMATTTFDSAFPPTGDGIGGIPMVDGPFPGFNINLDITSMTVTSAVPLPPAIWLFGSGLLGLVSMAQRRRRR